MNHKMKLLIWRHYKSQADFARALGICESSLSRIIWGRITPGEEIKKTIAERLGVKVEEIFSE